MVKNQRRLGRVTGSSIRLARSGFISKNKDLRACEKKRFLTPFSMGARIWAIFLSKCQGFSVKIALLGVKMGKIMLR